MTSAELLGLLAETTLASSAAIGLALLVRRPLRRWFGAGAGYAAWLVVPVAIIAVLLPAMAAPVLPVSAIGDARAVAAGIVTGPSTPSLPAPWLLVAWLVGAIAMAMRLGVQQHAFLASLGDMRPRPDGALQAGVVAGLPAVVGLVHPRVVLPAGFETRYSIEQQALLQAHERQHVVRGDLWTNAIVAALRCLAWFNPLVHLAARCFRHDQELACDQRVLATLPGSRRAYGEAMVNTQLAAQPLPFGCHWGFGHPLKERIAMLKQPLPSRRRWIAGAALVTALTSFAGVAAWAAQPPSASPTTPAAAASDAPSSTTMKPPKYPAAAVEQKISGRVVLLIDIDPSGNPTAIEVEKAEPAGVFEEQAVAAAWNWKFEPEIKDGEPVASRVRVPVDFKIDPPAEVPNDAGAMAWASPSATEGAGRVTEMECDEAKSEIDGSVACGNRQVTAAP